MYVVCMYECTCMYVCMYVCKLDLECVLFIYFDSKVYILVEKPDTFLSIVKTLPIFKTQNPIARTLVNHEPTMITASPNIHQNRGGRLQRVA